jgi:CHRD domain
MRSKLLVPILAVLVLGVAGCGSSSSSSASSSKTLPPAAKSAGPLRIYRVRLYGAKAETPPGAPQGTGDAVIAFHGSSLVCWRFAHLHGLINATFAHIHIGAKGKSGNIVVPLSTGPALHHQGCVTVSAVLVKAIESHPANYYVNIHSKQYPNGAVRAQL